MPFDIFPFSGGAMVHCATLYNVKRTTFQKVTQTQLAEMRKYDVL
jgi:hypothetical protein